MTQPANGHIVRINLGRVGALIAFLLFAIQIATIIITSVRSSANLTARVDVLASEVIRLVEANKDLVELVSRMTINQALDRQRLEILEKANPVRIRP